MEMLLHYRKLQISLWHHIWVIRSLSSVCVKVGRKNTIVGNWQNHHYPSNSLIEMGFLRWGFCYLDFRYCNCIITMTFWHTIDSRVQAYAEMLWVGFLHINYLYSKAFANNSPSNETLCVLEDLSRTSRDVLQEKIILLYDFWFW